MVTSVIIDRALDVAGLIASWRGMIVLGSVEARAGWRWRIENCIMRSSAPSGSVPPARAVNDVMLPRSDVEDNGRTTLPWKLVSGATGGLGSVP